VDLAVSYEPQTIIAAARGLDVVVIGRLIEHPLTTLLFLKGRGIRVPRDLEGKKIGYTVPGLMDVLLDAFARLNGIQQYERINVGFAIVQSLAAGKVDAVMGPFKTYETVTMAQKGYDVGYFELEKWGIPDYDELVFVSSKKTLKNNEASLGAFQRVIKRAIEHARKTPETALKDYLTEVPEADRKIETAAFQLTLPYYATRQELDVKRWQQFADFALQYGLVEKRVDVTDVLWTQGN
jgi:putative hydroxymethylpyrimidine transport system substrate-binding protein